MRKKIHAFIYATGLQRSVMLLRNCGLLEKNQFLEIQGPISSVVTTPRKGGKPTVRYIAKIKIRFDFDPNVVYLRFNRRGSSIYISWDGMSWMCINKFRD